MVRSYYHATAYINLDTILTDGINVSSYDNTIYLCETAIDCLKFMYVRRITDCVVIEVLLDDAAIHETFDHSYEFFKCRCYGINRRIETSEIIQIWRHKL